MNYIIFPIIQNQETVPELICKFKLRLDYVIDIYNTEIEYNKKICPTLPKNALRHKEFEAIKILKNELVESMNLNVDKEYNYSKYISVFVSPLIFNRKFESVYCAKCCIENKATDVSVQNWSEGESLYAEGGRMLYCKNGHHLFKMMEWNT